MNQKHWQNIYDLNIKVNLMEKTKFKSKVEQQEMLM